MDNVDITDIDNIASGMGVFLTDDEMQDIQDAYPAEASWNPDMIWYNILEDMIYARI